MGPCCVEGCEITSEETFYFEFPTSRLLRRKWLELIPLPGKLPLGTVVCSRHFNSDDYETVRGKVRLKRKVVPSLLLDLKQKIPSEPQKSPLPLTTTSPPASPQSPPSPPKEPDACDSTTVSVPSPIDAEKMIDDIQRRITGSINVLMKNGVNGNPIISPLIAPPVIPPLVTPPVIPPLVTPPVIPPLVTPPVIPPLVTPPVIPPLTTPPVIPPLDQKEDIEDMITNYHIKNKVPNTALLADILPSPLPLTGPGHTVPVEFEADMRNDDPIVIEDVKEADPVFIEVSVDKDASTAGAGSQDCLMLLESVQVDVDPATLILAHDDDYYREQEPKTHKKEDPISLLTSSDEDDVILQEPHIDTVEVSDETDEDDMPLVKLVKKKSDKKKKKNKESKLKKPRQNIEKIVWGMYDFYCVQCHFSTKNSTEYKKHISEHSTVLHVCPICSYTSSSKSMYARHTRIHKVEKKFKCHLCDYRARHKMSLIYHLKKHDSASVANIKDFKCKRCNFKTDDRSKVLGHLRTCRDSDKKHVCDKCHYSTNKKSDLKRHSMRRHRQYHDDDENDEDFVL